MGDEQKQELRNRFILKNIFNFLKLSLHFREFPVIGTQPTGYLCGEKFKPEDPFTRGKYVTQK